ncbi:MAG: electron transport complex subunit RsxC [candidate division WOR-3 bacterium]
MVKLYTFGKSGVSPEERKEYTENKKIEKFESKEYLYLAVNQHIGASAKVLVKEGDRVLKNQVVASGEGGVTSMVHSPVSGEVVQTKSMVFPGEIKNDVLVIKNDFKYEKVAGTDEKREFKTDRENFINEIKNGGIIGMGGAGFPTYVKMNPPKDKKIDLFIVNAAECEPYLTNDYRVMLEFKNEFLNGISLILDNLGIPKSIVGIEENKEEAFEELKKVNTDKRIEFKLLKTKYPQGAEKQLIFALTRRVVPIRKLPFEVGVIVQNVSTVKAIYDLIVFNKPLIERVLTCSGKGIVEPKNILAPIGVTVSQIADFCGGIKNDCKYLINGGPMMGKPFTDIELPVTKTTSGLLFLTDEEVSVEEESTCIRCSKCLSVCPMGLNPTYLKEASDRREYEKMDDVLDCIECGSCSFICPASRDLAASIVKGKQKYTKYLKRGK